MIVRPDGETKRTASDSDDPTYNELRWAEKGRRSSEGRPSHRRSSARSRIPVPQPGPFHGTIRSGILHLSDLPRFENGPAVRSRWLKRRRGDELFGDTRHTLPTRRPAIPPLALLCSGTMSSGRWCSHSDRARRRRDWSQQGKKTLPRRLDHGGAGPMPDGGSSAPERQGASLFTADALTSPRDAARVAHSRPLRRAGERDP